MKWLWMVLVLGVAACGVDGAPVPPGSDVDPDNITDPEDFDPGVFF
ncbi:hypothetical protein P1J78_09785 [Psychromarinibacter sp. C21-152]|uniref:Lipoprotein n=1 Tax=Psychromarinibacter sediminicola TaxID=3033385 RepID=A0AAE3NSV1_9RHOB|nr:hypothetical protein [Psychromarinibacter sediminicola]MDF0601019.1 hypothetical protein [Psychromarinibacter sediminicola]